jgi:hypothetical protein
MKCSKLTSILKWINNNIQWEICLSFKNIWMFANLKIVFGLLWDQEFSRINIYRIKFGMKMRMKTNKIKY